MSHQNVPLQISSIFNPSNFSQDSDIVTVGNLLATVQNNSMDAGQQTLIDGLIASSNTLHDQVVANTTYQTIVEDISSNVYTLQNTNADNSALTDSINANTSSISIVNTQNVARDTHLTALDAKYTKRHSKYIKHFA